MKKKINLVSGWSAPGGSTQHHINLTNLLNDEGYDCTFYGPQKYHLDKCKADSLERYRNDSDVVIGHFLNLPSQFVNDKKFILSCHESDLFSFKSIDTAHVDTIQFVSFFQAGWYSKELAELGLDNWRIIPPVVEGFSYVRPDNNIAGVVGSIDSHKRPHQSIDRAIAEGMKKVMLFGDVTDLNYFTTHIQPLIDKGTVGLAGHIDSKEEMYNSVDKVYHDSKRETYGLVAAECIANGVPFSGGESFIVPVVESKDQILDKWISLLES